MKPKTPSAFYQIGLGSKTLLRARIIFIIISAITFLSIAGAVYAESQTGQLQKILVQPIKSFLAEMTKPSAPNPGVTDTEPVSPNNVSTTITNTTIITTPKPATKQTQPIIYQVSPAPTPPATSTDQTYQDYVNQTNQWAAEQKAAADKWYQDNVNKNNADYAAAVAKQQQDYDAAVKKAQEDQAAWKAAHGF